MSNWIDRLPDTPRAAVLGSMMGRRFARGALIYTRKEAPQGLYVIREGTALFALDGPKGNRFLLRILRPGDLFGESFALDGEPAGVLVEARSDLRVDLIPAHRIAALEQAHPEIEQALARVAARHLRQTLEVLAEQALMDLPERTISRLAWLCREAGGAGPIRLELAQSELAAMLGASRQAVHAELVKLEQQGVLIRQFRAIACDPDRLARLF